MNKRGKITLSVIIISILLISLSLYSILATAGNAKSYDTITRTITVKNGATEIAKIKLNTPTVYNVIRGKDRLVAEFTIENYVNGYSNIFENMEFYNLKDNSKKIDRKFTYKYKTIIGQREIPYYREECINLEMNQTFCNKILDEINYEDIIEWKTLDINNLPKGNITLGIFTDVYPDENIEWIPTLFGVRINEWASWNESLNIELEGVYHFDEGIGTNAAELLGGVNNFTLLNSLGWTTGKIGNGTGLYDKVNDYMSLTNISAYNFTNTSSFTYCIGWNKTQTGEQHIISKMAGNGMDGNSGLEILDYNNVIYVELKTTQVLSSPVHVTDGLWKLICVSYDGSQNTNGVKIYINGTDYTSSGSGNPVPDISGNGNLTVGGATPVFNYGVSGSVDHLYIWGRNLSASEISTFYNEGNWLVYEVPSADTTPPNATQPTIIPPIPKTNQDLHCNATLTDNLQTNLIAFWKWYKNGVSYLSGNTLVTNGTNSLITILNAGNTTKGEGWICEVTPYDGINYGSSINSTAVTILNSAPIQDNPLLSTLSGKNFNYENLTCYNQSTYDVDNDAVINIYNWYKDSQPLKILNLPFEINTNDYSGNNNHGTNYGATSTNGKVGKALSFDGVDDTVSVDLSNFPSDKFTFEMWFNAKEFASNGRDLFTKYSANDGFRTLITSSGQIESAWDIGDTFNTLITTGINPNTWYHFVVTYNGSLLELYLNGDLKDSEIDSGNLTIGTNTLTLGFNDLATPNFNGSIDELKIYNHALTSQQIQANYNLEYNKIVSQETSGGDNYMCQITPNDAEEDGITLNSSVAEIKWAITFDVRDSYSNVSINGMTITCNYTNFNQEGDTTNPYGPYGFVPGNWECNFTKFGYYTKTQSFLANDDKTVNVKLSEEKQLTVEEHTWLEAIYNCVVLGDCNLYNMLLEMNQTVGKIWEHTKPTDNSVITFENITNKIVNSASNLTIDYTVNIPIKAGYSLGTYLPVRIGYWFLDSANTTCYNQGDKPTGVEEPYCQPLIIETIGPMGGQVNFTVRLYPSLPAGNYSIKRIIDIDPNNVWINYGQELISSFTMAESLTTYGISIEKSGEIIPEKQGLLENIGSTITGAVTGIGESLLSGWQIVSIIAIVGLVLIISIISRTIIKLKKR